MFGLILELLNWRNDIGVPSGFVNEPPIIISPLTSKLPNGNGVPIPIFPLFVIIVLSNPFVPKLKSWFSLFHNKPDWLLSLIKLKLLELLTSVNWIPKETLLLEELIFNKELIGLVIPIPKLPLLRVTLP